MTKKPEDSRRVALRIIRFEIRKHEAAIAGLKKQLPAAKAAEKAEIYGLIAKRHRRLSRLCINLQETL